MSMMDETSGPASGVLTRRRFIERLGLVGGTTMILAGMEALGFGIGSAHAAPPVLSGTGNGKSIVVLGAGLAGMTAAYELTKSGYKV
ncbi:MAG: NAD(P)-binding protein, partial [Caulobacteraceae bacterium]|nr:NAD(P)-binding protein [Caulobacteraceae bacterium]